MKRNNNKTVVNLHKVQFADFYYRNQWLEISSKAHSNSVHCYPYNPESQAFIVGYPSTGFTTETMEQLALRLRIKDIWTPELRLQLGANHSLTYTGEKAKSIWKAWCELQFNRNKKK